MTRRTILKTVVGSHAHGLAQPESDMDYRGVFLVPTRDFFTVGRQPQRTSWVETEGQDDTSWELAHFLNLAYHCNPTILEVFLAPVIEAETWGYELRELFPYTWNASGVLNAFRGYGHNQRKKFFDKRTTSYMRSKFAAAYLRTLFWGIELLETGTFTVRIVDTEIGEVERRWREGKFTAGEVIETCLRREEELEAAYVKHHVPDEKVADLDKLTAFHQGVRHESW